MRGKVLLLAGAVALAVLAWCTWARARKDEPVPQGQDRMPGPALSPAEAIRKMTVPPGFSVELVAAEPDLINPVAMTFDERGRIWVTESVEYPRRSAGPGRDRIKILEDTDGDGKVDKVTVFAEGLNIPSGIAVGHGGVWVANAPDILFYREKDGKAVGKPEVVVTGFGRHDTHELPNSLTWGPDGYLYGLNGVFNDSHVRQGGKDFRFSCAMFRINPRTREFQLFAEGTSNPWGIAWDSEGSGFVSACVIDHLWHLAETGYYHRQGGPYPPFTWEMGSIVRHKHQKAAYCGLHYFDSDAYPPEYRGHLYMGNIHGSCINVDVLGRDGSTYVARAAPDFLTANDPWFMPVSQKTGPDGCLYILDWYDRYHCYQDANRDPKGIDRLRGRLYRVRYKGTPRAPRFDLARESDDQLVRRLYSPNIYFRDTAQRLLGERNTPSVRARLEQLVLDARAPRKARMHALWALVSTGRLDPGFHQRLLAHEDSAYRAWGVRAAGNFGKVDAALRSRVEALAQDPSRDVQLQMAIAARKVEGVDPIPLLVRVLAGCGADRLIPHIIWQNLHPLLEDQADRFLEVVGRPAYRDSVNVAALMPRVVERILGRRPRAAGRGAEPALIVSLFRVLAEGKTEADTRAAGRCLALLARKVQSGELAGAQAAALYGQLRPILHGILEQKGAGRLREDAAVLAATLKDPEALGVVRKVFASGAEPPARRIQALQALIAAGDGTVLDEAAQVLADSQATAQQFRAQVLEALGKLDDPRVAGVVLAVYPRMEPNLQPRAVELLTQRPAWARQLLGAMARKEVAREALNVNQARRLLASRDAELVRQVQEQWGRVREGRNPEREKVVADMRTFLSKHQGNARAGAQVFQKLCGQCHKIYGEGQDVGPDITVNGRGSFEQLLSNVFDPSLVIGPAYQATTVMTTKGRALTGLLVEDSPRRVVLKVQGGQLETVPRSQIEEVTISPVSLMPEGIETQLTRQEIADLFAFLILDRPPDDPHARKIPGAP